MQGFEGLIQDAIQELNARSVSNIIHLGGTVLKTARSAEFCTEAGMEKAFKNLKKRGIEGIVAIGGDGTFAGIRAFTSLFDIRAVGIPGTIDNDLYGSDFTLGYDTAINTVIEAIDKIRDTADSHDRLFFVEVMGRDSGCIALRSAVASGAEAVLLPEKEISIDRLVEMLKIGSAAKKSSSIVIVSEGNKLGNAYTIAELVKERFKHYDTKVTVLGHLQRGGSPSGFDRILGSRLGYHAVKELINGNDQIMVGLRGNRIQTTSLDETLHKHTFNLEPDLMEMLRVLSI